MADRQITTSSGHRMGLTTYGDPIADRLVVMFHPMPGSGTFDPSPDATHHWGVHMLAPDRPGYGSSDPIRDGELASFARHAKDIATYLRSVEKDARAASDTDFGTVGVIGWVDMSAPGSDALGLGLPGRQGVLRCEVLLADLLDLRVEAGGDLLPRGDRGRREGALQLGPEGLELLVRRDGLVLPGALQRRQIGDLREPFHLDLRAGEVLDQLPGAVSVLRALEDADVRAAEEARAALLLQSFAITPSGLLFVHTAPPHISRLHHVNLRRGSHDTESRRRCPRFYW